MYNILKKGFMVVLIIAIFSSVYSYAEVLNNNTTITTTEIMNTDIESEIHNEEFKEFTDKIYMLKIQRASENLLEELIYTKQDVLSRKLDKEKEEILLVEINRIIQDVEKKIYSELLIQYKKEKASVRLKSNLENLKTDVENSYINIQDKYKILDEIYKVIDEVTKDISMGGLKITESEIKKEIKLEVIKDGLFIVLPELGGNYEYVYDLYSGSKNIDNGNTDSLIKVRNIKEKTTLKLDLQVMDYENDIELISMNTTVVIDDTQPPVIEYAYIEESVIHISYYDNIGLGNKDLVYEINGKMTETSKDYIRVNIPSKITVEITDLFENKTTQVFDIKEDNIVLMGTVPSKKINELEVKKISEVKKYYDFENVIHVEFGKKADLVKELGGLALSKFGKYNSGDITITSSDLKVDNSSMVHFDKEGIYSIHINHSFYTKDSETVYVIIPGKSVLYTNIAKINIINPFIVYDNNINISDYIEYDLIKEGYSPMTDFMYYRGMDETKLHPINETIEIEKDKVNKFEIINLYSNERYYITIKFIEKEELKTASYTDLTYKHWAYHDIKDLTLEILVTGYEDKTFKPDTEVTVKEFMTMLSRFISNQQKDKIKPVVNNSDVNLSITDWAYVEVKSIINRVDTLKLKSFNTDNLNRNITREEVAFLIYNTTDIGNSKNNGVHIKDIYESQYSSDVQNLVSNNIITGYSDKTFRPKKEITRAEVVTIINRIRLVDK